MRGLAGKVLERSAVLAGPVGLAVSCGRAGPSAYFQPFFCLRAGTMGQRVPGPTVATRHPPRALGPRDLSAARRQRPSFRASMPGPQEPLGSSEPLPRGPRRLLHLRGRAPTGGAALKLPRVYGA